MARRRDKRRAVEAISAAPNAVARDLGERCGFSVDVLFWRFVGLHDFQRRSNFVFTESLELSSRSNSPPHQNLGSVV
jgi:hypothetical protein